MSLLLGFGGPTNLKALIATLYHHLCGPLMNGLGQTHNAAILMGRMITLEHPFCLFIYFFFFLRKGFSLFKPKGIDVIMVNKKHVLKKLSIQICLSSGCMYIVIIILYMTRLHGVEFEFLKKKNLFFKYVIPLVLCFFFKELVQLLSNQTFFK